MEKMIQKLALNKQMYLLALVSVLGVIVMIVYDLHKTEWGLSSDTLLLGTVISATLFWLAHYLGKQAAYRSASIVKALEAMAEGDLSIRPKVPGKDEFSWMAWQYGSACKQITSVIHDIQKHADELTAAAEEIATITAQTRAQVQHQNDQTGHLATAMTEMTTTIQSVTRDIAETASDAIETDSLAQEGKREFESTLDGIMALTGRTDEIAAVIERLKNDSIAIGGVLEVIQGIAEQTNLLALNAAIEAARAGEQGRGFAVVADEVRTLASRTQESTREIQEMIERLQQASHDAVEAITAGRVDVETSSQRARKAGATLQEILPAVDRISKRNAQIAAAAEQQSVTAEEINRNVVTIHDISQDAAGRAEQTACSGEQLARLAVQLQELVNRFRV